MKCIVQKKQKNLLKNEKNIKPYKQKGDTCAIVCMLMVLEFYKKIDKINWYDERRFYRLYSSKYVNGTPFSAIGFHMAKNNLNVAIYHESKNLFDNNNVFNNEDFEYAMNEYKEYLLLAKNKGAKIFNGILINTDLLIKKLQENNFIILAGELSGNYHAILLISYDKNGFKVCDPLYKNIQIRTIDEINIFMNTNIGKWFISINDKNKL